MLDTCTSGVNTPDRFEWIAAYGEKNAKKITAWEELSSIGEDFEWLFGGISYELKNSLEDQLESVNPSFVPFPEITMFFPEVVIYRKTGCDEIHVIADDPLGIFEEIQLVRIRERENELVSDFRQDLSKGEYLTTVKQVRDLIAEGEFYELNLTQQFQGTARLKAPFELYERLISVSPVPMAAFFKWEDTFVLSASPERFLVRNGDRLTSKPIKGTIQRGKTSAEDERLKAALAASEKDKAENVMIVDLTRNDLNRVCQSGSVEVSELFGVHTFPQLHHMVSTISGTVEQGVTFSEILQATFPPGSMTGAPKHRVCQWIDRLERSARGIYAGSIGYLDDQGDFDLSVVIRTLVYDNESGHICYNVGGAVTWDSEPEAEYEESLLKAKAIRALFESDHK